MKDIMTLSFWIQRFRFGSDQASEEETIHNIESGIVFQGAKLWVLILAIFVASLGLNTNSTAVIIGAMLISPLMGPILGMGLSAGIHDFVLLKKAFRNYFVATLFSVATACLYFMLTPVHDAQSELLARTSPTIFDVLIAFVGGLAGIIGLSSKSQRTGNVIPGVAIATALMPPLCTVGFGLATANWLYAAGALYLYLINTVFISLATYIGVEFIFKFNKRTQLASSAERKFKYILAVLGVFVIIPSLYLTVMMVHQSIFEDNVHRFFKEEVVYKNTHLINSDIDYKNRRVQLVLMGEEIDSAEIRNLKDKLPYYHLSDVNLTVVQGSAGITEEAVQNMVRSTQEHSLVTAQMLSQANEHAKVLEDELASYHRLESLVGEILPEMKALYPQVTSLTLAKGKRISETDTLSTSSPATVAILIAEKKVVPAEQERIKEWLKERLDSNDLELVLK